MLKIDNRPHNNEKLNLLFNFQWTFQMAVSIVHRGTGIIIFLFIPPVSIFPGRIIGVSREV